MSDFETQTHKFIPETAQDNKPLLPPELIKYVSIERLVENVKNYPEMSQELTEVQKERIKKIKEILEQIPLIHATSNESIAKGLTDLKPIDELPSGQIGHSLESDRSLGLTKCVFFGWGLSQKGYGRFITKFSPKLLNSDNVFVTPMDIGHIEFADHKPFEDFEEERKRRIDESYFSSMVTGKDWQEIIARRMLKHIEEDNHFFPLYDLYTMGEIKHYGTVPAQQFLDSFKTSDMRAHYKYLYEHGFSFANMEQDNRLYKKTGKRYGVDPLYDECDINYEEASDFWKKTLDIK
ncbi:MAG: hypothetical protein PHQ18_03970 [Patescibacteria group bacterium]|nr:hypothetical protein [Patescibacteria group bacterium]